MTDRVREFLERDDIKEFIANEELDKVYDKCKGWDVCDEFLRTNLTQFLLSRGVYPDEYMTRIPNKYLIYSSIETYSISPTITSIGDKAFDGCHKLTSVSIPNNVVSIGCSAFYGCYSLTSITIPDSVETIGHEAFGACCKLADVKIGNKLTSLPENLFYGCRNLVKINLQTSVTSIGKRAFANCGNIEIFYDGTKNQWRTIQKDKPFENTYYVIHCTDGDIVKRGK